MNVFTKAAPATSTATKAKKSEATLIPVIGLEELSIYDLGIKTLTTLKAAADAEVKSAQKAYFVAAGTLAKKRPANFKGTEGIATASCELRIRSSASPLSTAEQALLAEHNIPTEVVTTTTETFIINPAYLNDSALLEKVGSAIGKIKGVPEDFIQKQAGAQKTVVAENALDALFALGDTDIAAQLLSVVGTLAVKPTVTDVKAALARISDLLLAATA